MLLSTFPCILSINYNLWFLLFSFQHAILSVVHLTYSCWGSSSQKLTLQFASFVHSFCPLFCLSECLWKRSATITKYLFFSFIVSGAVYCVRWMIYFCFVPLWKSQNIKLTKSKLCSKWEWSRGAKKRTKNRRYLLDRNTCGSMKYLL